MKMPTFCDNCNCMTKTTSGLCGKCEHVKNMSTTCKDFTHSSAAAKPMQTPTNLCKPMQNPSVDEAVGVIHPMYSLPERQPLPEALREVLTAFESRVRDNAAQQCYLEALGVENEEGECARAIRTKFGLSRGKAG